MNATTRHSALLVLFLTVSPGLAANDVANTPPIASAVPIPKITTERGSTLLIDVPKLAARDVTITMDGHLDEPIWSAIPAYDDMLTINPDTLANPSYRTLARYFYTEDGMYVGAKLEQPAESLVARLSSRDKFINRDSFGIYLDTSGDGLYGYFFIVHLGGAVMDGKIAPERQYSMEWDGPWNRATAELPDGWSVEMFLPWSMMALPQVDGLRNIGFHADRSVAHLNERWGVPPLAFSSARFMSALGSMTFDDVDPGRQFDLYPYTSYTYDEMTGQDEYRAGLDLFWRPSTNFQVTATANPDFGAVESDDVVINLTAFETFFPEKRLFFVEGNEIFKTTPREKVFSGGSSSSGGARRSVSTYNPTPTTLVNTRRIGGTPDIDVPPGIDVAGVELGRPTELRGAAKVTGQNGGWRYGVLTAFEEDVRRVGEDISGQPVRLEQDGRNFGVARMLYEATGEGRWSAGYIGTIVQHQYDDAIVHGIDAHFLSNNGELTLDTQLMTSEVDGERGRGALVDMRYVPNRQWRHSVQLDFLDDKLDISDLGFIRRNDATGIQYGATYNTSQGLKRLRTRSANYFLNHEVNGDGRAVRSGLFVSQGWTFHDSSQVRVDFDYSPEQWDDRNSFDNGSFKVERRVSANASYGTNTRESLSVSIAGGVSEEALGGLTYRGVVGFTYKPNDRFSLDFDAEYFRRDGWLLHQEDRNMTTFASSEWRPRLEMDLFITARQQLRFTMQWAGIRADEQEFWQIPVNDGSLQPVTKGPSEPTDDFTISRLTAQVRYRWEIGPLSDLFVVYTRGSNLDNRISDDFGDLFHDTLITPIIDVLVLKLRYRFGL